MCQFYIPRLYVKLRAKLSFTFFVGDVELAPKNENQTQHLSLLVLTWSDKCL